MSCYLCSYSQAACSCADISGLVKSAPERKLGATLHGHRKCSQADFLQGYHHLWKLALGGGYM